jgi:photosystem II stability/assembly factor-like uncharacterized protein
MNIKLTFLLAVIPSCLAFSFDSATAATPQTAGPVTAALQWRMIGPFRGGRTRAVVGVPSKPNLFYIGAVDGGIWRTDDAGRTWQPIFDDQPTQSIGAIAVAPSDPNIIYVGSGEGLHRPDLSVGDGMYRSDDAGRTWRHLGLADSQQIPDVAVDPGNPERVFAAVLGHPFGSNPERGIYRSVDGGKNWQKMLGKDNDTGGSAIAIDPGHPNIVYAALWQDRLGPWEDKNQFQGTGGGLFKSTDGGEHWDHLTAGLPENTTQINFSIAASRPDRIYAVVGTNEPSAYSSAAGLGFFRSEDGGRSWNRITSDPRPSLRIGGGDLPIVRVDPSNPDTVYSTGLVTMKSVDGGVTWTSLRGAPGGDDYQNLWINPNHSDTLALVSDQGAVITLNGGKTWSSWFNQPTAQLYHVSVSPTFPYRVCGGQQESGSVCISSRGNDGSITDRDWHPVGVIEYGYVAPDPLDPDVIYGAGRNVVSRFHQSTGQVQDVTPIPLRSSSIRVTRTEPLLFSPSDPHKLFYAANQVYRTVDAGMHWDVISPDLTRETPGIPASVGTMHGPNMDTQRGSVYALGISQHDQFIWAGTSDGLVWRTGDSGKNWSNVTPPGLTAWSKVAQIDASHFDDETAYVAVNRMRIDDLRPYAFKTHDGGKTWQSIANGLPADEPVNSVREDTQRKGLLFAATEKSVWVSADDGDHWSSLQLNLPRTSMRDLWIHGSDLIVGTHGRSIWILDDISLLRQLGCCASPHSVELIQPSAAYRLEQSTWTDTPIPPDEPLGRNPPAGAIIDYILPANIKGKVTLEILDVRKQLVTRFTSNDPLKPTAEELARELIPAYWIAESASLPATPGAHRWIWDLHYPAPDTTVRGYPISAVPHATRQEPQGPLALPGEYVVRLTAGGRTVEKPLVVAPDPRVKVPASALGEQFQLASRLSGVLSESSRSVLAAQSERAQIQALAGDSPRNTVIVNFKQKLTDLLEPLSEAQENIDTLYKQIVKADAAPTAVQLAASEAEEKKLTPLLSSWKQIQTELPAVNKALRAAHLGQIRAELPPPRDRNVADEE